ncbi:hypothetical protein [Sphingomonas sp. RS2018]
MTDPVFGRGNEIRHETVRLGWSRFGPLFAGDTRRQQDSTPATP